MHEHCSCTKEDSSRGVNLRATKAMVLRISRQPQHVLRGTRGHWELIHIEYQAIIAQRNLSQRDKAFDHTKVNRNAARVLKEIHMAYKAGTWVSNFALQRFLKSHPLVWFLTKSI